jgi:NADH-quinone oxidoreductase subunit I
MYGIGILKGLGVTLRHFVNTFVDDIQYLGRKGRPETFQQRQSLNTQGLVTVEYPEEKLAVPERFRFVPFLVTYNHDDPEYAGKDWCTSCGICAKVCPPQCIWIVRGTNPETGRPKPEPEQFYIDIDVCMNCGYCAEYCPFDAIKMDHDYELASFDRTTHHIFDKPKLSKEIRYWQSIAPTVAQEEEVARGGYDHTDVQKSRKKANLPASRPGPVSDRPAAAAVAAPAAATPEVPADRATVAQGQASGANAPVSPQAPVPPQPAGGTTGAATTADGKPIVRRRGATKAAGEAGTAPAQNAPGGAPEAGGQTAVDPANRPMNEPVTNTTAGNPAGENPRTDVEQSASDTGGLTPPKPGMVLRGKRWVDPNAPAPVVRRKGKE